MRDKSESNVYLHRTKQDTVNKHHHLKKKKRLHVNNNLFKYLLKNLPITTLSQINENSIIVNM